jgi:hypothetical protein
LISQGKYLISSSIDGLIVVYDYNQQQLFRELKDPRSLASPSSMLLTKGEKFLIVCEQYGITVVDIEEAQIVNPTVNNKDFNRLVRLSIPNDNGVNAFAGLSATG